MKNWLFVGCALLCAVVNGAVVNATPYVTNVVAKQRYPWNGLVDVSYEIVGSTNGIDFAYGHLEAIDQKTQKSYLARTFTKPIDLSEGTHTAIWDMSADHAVASTAMVFRVLIRTLPLYRIIDVSEGSTATSYPVLEMEAIPDGGWSDEYKTNNIVLRRIDGTNGVYYAGIFQITEAQWDKVMGGISASTYPKVEVTYNSIRGNDDTYNWPTTTAVDATSFIGKLRQKTELTTLDLPSEAEWEFAARAGVTTKWLCGDSAGNSEKGLAEYAWYDANSKSSIHEVGLKKPNNWDLYDVHGNVEEWCLDFDPNDHSRMLCGGEYSYDADRCTFAYRGYNSPNNVWAGNGFRLFCRSGSNWATVISSADSPAVVCSADSPATFVDSRSGVRSVSGTNIDISLAYDASWIGGDASAEVAIAVDGVVLWRGTGVGNCVWADATYGTHALTYTNYINGVAQEEVYSATFTVDYTIPPPLTLSDVSVAKIEPFGLAIDYTVDDVMEGAEGYVPEVTLTLADRTTNIVAKTVTGATDAKAGQHRIYWNMAKDGIDSFEGATINVTYKEAPYCVIDLSGGKDATSYPVAYLASEPEGGFTNDTYKTTKLVLKRVDAGEFIMGENPTSAEALANHKVTLTKSFYMGLFEVTQAQWTFVMGSNPSNFKDDGAKKPVDLVSYNDIRGSSDGAKWPISNAVDADSFLGRLRAKTGDLAFDLPTEAQWEYTCRAGTMTTYSYGSNANGDYMWYVDNSEKSTHEVGTKNANPWGFYDMHGNVWEWSSDWYAPLSYGTDPKGSSWGSSSGLDRALRGGGWSNKASRCTSSECTNDGDPALTYDYYGFRLSRTIPTTSITPVMATGVSAQKPTGVVITPPDGDVTTAFVISNEWFETYYPNTSADARQTIAEGAGVKTNASGVAAPVWHDYVAGTDPTNAASKFTAKIEMKDGVPSITWDPALNGEGVREGNLRTYRVWGKSNLGDESWSEVSSGAESGYNFFRVTVEMP